MKWAPVNKSAFDIPEKLAFCLRKYYCQDRPPHYVQWDESSDAFMRGLIAAGVEGAVDFSNILEEHEEILLIEE